MTGGPVAPPGTGRPDWTWPGPVPRTRRPGSGVGTYLAVAVLGVLTLVAIGVVGAGVGNSALPVAVGLAAVPLVGVLLAIRWVDRWEPEPWQSLAVGFGWGASVSVLVALVLNTGAALVLEAAGASATDALTVSAVVVAPLVEESVKALGVLVVFLVWRRTFDGPVDGLVHAATVAAGFAFVENVLYFGESLAVSAAAPEEVVVVFVLRAVLSPFAHVLFTACVGFALGLVSRSPYRWLWCLTLPVGLLAAVALHALWNGSAVVGAGEGFWGLYVTVQVPFFLLAVAVVVWLRRSEARVVRDRLGEYAAAGWFDPREVAVLASLGERRRARAWAAARGGRPARTAMRDLQHRATVLAYQRQRTLAERAWHRDRREEAELLADVVEARHRLRAALAA